MKTIGIISRIEKGKGQDILINATNILIKKYKDIKVLIVGEGDTKELNLLIKKFNLSKNVKLLGYQDNKEKIFRSLDVFVFPTYWPLEGFGLVLLEAMKYKIPVVATNFGPVPEVVGDAAILVPANNYVSLASAIDRVLSNKTLANKLISNGEKNVKKFDIKNIAKLYEMTISETLNNYG